MYTLTTHNRETNFNTMDELVEHIQFVHVEDGSWDQIKKITDCDGNRYTCEVEIQTKWRIRLSI